MSRISREYLVAGRNIPAGAEHRRARSLTGGGRAKEERMELDLFSRTHGSLSIGSANEIDGQDVLTRLQRLTSGSAKRSGMDDLLDADSGKHDYDWLLTPPGTPPAPPLNASKNPPSSTAPKHGSIVRSVSTTRASRVSSSPSENGHSTRPVRSSSVTRPSVSSSNNRTSVLNTNNNRTSVLSTSLASVTSRPSTPNRRQATSSTTKPSTPTSRPVPARSPTPVKTRPTPSSPGLKSGPSLNSRPSTPTSRPRIPANLNSSPNSLTARSNSRSSTPTRQPIVPPSITSRSPSVGRMPATNGGRTSAPSSRPSSPSPRPRAPVRPIDLPDFLHDVPPNLRTRLPERPVSAGRLRPGTALTVRASSNSEPATSLSSNRRLSLPIVAKGKFQENPMKVPLHSNGHHATAPEIQKPGLSEVGARRPSKPAMATESTGFGRTISKKSLDMALRHMDIRQSMGGLRGASVFPQSIRSAASKGRPARKSDPIVPVANDEHSAENANGNGTISTDSNGAVSCSGDSRGSKSPEVGSRMARDHEVELDIYGSTRYDAMLLKEDSNNMNWLHSIEDKADQSPVFEHRFEPLPEPFSPL